MKLIFIITAVLTFATLRALTPPPPIRVALTNDDVHYTEVCTLVEWTWPAENAVVRRVRSKTCVPDTIFYAGFEQ